MNRSSASGVVLGLFIVLFGVLAMGNGIFGWGFEYLAYNWWALVIIAVSVVSIVHRGFRFWNVLFLFLGLWLFFGRMGFFGRYLFPSAIALILIFIGVYLIVKSVTGSSGRSYAFDDFSNQDGNDFAHYDSCFSRNSVSNSSKAFKGGNINAVFGTTVVDLSQIQIQGRAAIEVSAVFGRVEIKMPRSIPYRTDVTPVFGTFINNAPQLSPIPDMPYLEIKGSAIFGTCRLV